MNPRVGALALALLLPTCAAQDGPDSPATSVETARSALGTNPPSEIATWTRVAGVNAPDPRVGQAVAYDGSRKLVVVFGGAAAQSGDRQTLRQDVWEWNPATGAWRDRTPAGLKPDARSEAAVVYDSVRDRFILFGGRAGGGSNFEDTWEWNPTDGTWTDKTGAGQTPDARARHSMVYDVKRKVAVLFGGGRSIQGTTAAASTDVAAITTAFASTWEYEPVSAAWTDRTPASAVASPSARYDAGLVWDRNRNLVVLFGGMQKLDTSASGSFKQDTWEWNGEAGSWTERTASGTKPSARFGHGMAYDPGRSKVVLFGGCDDNAGATKNDLWDWEPGTGTWTERSVPTTVPSARVWASLVLVTALLTDSSPVRMELCAGAATAVSMGGAGTGADPNIIPVSSLLDEVWDLTPAPGIWNQQPAGTAVGPDARSRHAMATDLGTGKVYLFGGENAAATLINDLWAWDGTAWSQCKTTGASPAPRADAGMAYDPTRKSLIVFGGRDAPLGATPSLSDTWEWNIAQATWTELKVVGAPPGRLGAAMVTDVKRNRIIMASGADYGRQSPQNVELTDVWEWNGTTLTWTNVSPPVGWGGPQIPIGAWDTARSKLVAMEGESGPEYYEWDPSSHAWAPSAISDKIVPSSAATFDSTRRRMVALGRSYGADPTGTMTFTLELDTLAKQWFARPLPVELQQHNLSVMAYDNKRAVVVLFGGVGNTGGVRGDIWEYKVTGLGNGTGCSSDFASQCASSNCVEGVCCESAACAGPCQSCNVAGNLGTCTAAAAGAQVAGSCSGQTACDGTGKCAAANGTACTSGTACASGFCSDGVCCDSVCQGTCVSCNLPGRVGTCSPYQAGSDPEKECSKGTPPCQSSCDGLGSCAFPTNTCGQCGQCNGYGTCIENYYYPYCIGVGGAGGSGSGGNGGSSGDSGSGGAGGSGAVGGSGGAGGAGGFGGTGASAGFGGSSGVVILGGSGGLAGSASMGGRGGSGAGGSGAVGGSGGAAGADGTAGHSGLDGSSGPLTASTGGSPHDGGLVPVDGSGPVRDGGGASSDAKLGGGVDAPIVVTLRRGGCSCDLGNPSSPSGSMMILLGGFAWIARRVGKRRH